MASIINTVQTNAGRVQRIVNYLKSVQDFYIAIGKNTPWDNSFGINVSDINPPFPTETATTILEPIVYKKIEMASGGVLKIGASFNNYICGNEITPNLNTIDSKVILQQSEVQKDYYLIPVEEIENEDGTYNTYPNFVYISGSIFDTDYTESSWRVSALFTKLFLKEGVNNNKILYSPNEVKGGILHHLTYGSPIERQQNKEHKFEYLIYV